jgi:hypothetical protein
MAAEVRLGQAASTRRRHGRVAQTCLGWSPSVSWDAWTGLHHRRDMPGMVADGNTVHAGRLGHRRRRNESPILQGPIVARSMLVGLA